MKKCANCGKDYPDNMSVCPVDQTPLTGEAFTKAPDYPVVRTIVIRRFTFQAICKIVFIGVSIPIFSFSLLSGLLALFGVHTVHQKGVDYTGVAGLGLAIFNGSVATLIATFIFCITFTISFWFVSKFKPLRLICYIDKRTDETTDART
jgi:hypothetical protein